MRLSLGGSLVLAATALEEPIARITAVARRLRDPGATAESSVEAALRICDVLAGLPAEGAHRAVHEFRFDAAAGHPDDPRFDVTTLPQRLAGAEGFGGWYVPVAYRDWPGPRYVGEQAADLSLAQLLPQVAQRSAIPAPAPASGGGDAHERTRHRPPLLPGGVPPPGRDLTPDLRPAVPLPGSARPGRTVNGAPGGPRPERVHLPGVGCVRRPVPPGLHPRSGASRPGAAVRPPALSCARAL